MSLRYAFSTLMIVLVVCTPAFATYWYIEMPNPDDIFWNYATIECFGTGYTEVDYELRMRQGTTILAQTAGTTDSEATWGSHHFAPPSDPGPPPVIVPWPAGDTVVEVAMNGFPQPISYKKYAVGISIVEEE